MERGEGISAALDDRTVVQVGHFPTLSPMHHARRNIATQRCIVDTPQGGGAISHCVGLHAHIGVGVSTLSPWTASLYRAPRHSVVFYGSGSEEAPAPQQDPDPCGRRSIFEKNIKNHGAKTRGRVFGGNPCWTSQVLTQGTPMGPVCVAVAPHVCPLVAHCGGSWGSCLPRSWYLSQLSFVSVAVSS